MWVRSSWFTCGVRWRCCRNDAAVALGGVRPDARCDHRPAAALKLMEATCGICGEAWDTALTTSVPVVMWYRLKLRVNLEAGHMLERHPGVVALRLSAEGFTMAEDGRWEDRALPR